MFRGSAGKFAVVAVVALGATVMAARLPLVPGRRGEAKPKPKAKAAWELTASAYTFNRVTFVETVDKAKNGGFKYIEGFSWQKISPDTKDAEMNASAPADAVEKARRKLLDSGVHLVGYYVGDFGSDEPQARKVFEFARKMGVDILVAEPKPELLETLDRLAKEYRVQIAIHNHPKDPKKPAYTNWDPKNVMAMISKYSKNIGCCADTGHWVRSGLDPVACLKEYEGRLLMVHMKDVNEKGPEAHDVVLGTGVANVRGQLEELKRQKFRGPISLEYEYHMEDNLADVEQSAKFVKQVAAELGQEVALAQ